ncbi:helix-turn-helix transcriptional regulator [bacterium]|nr:helix-turn-helix transcriptional regulator [bacterium]
MNARGSSVAGVRHGSLAGRASVAGEGGAARLRGSATAGLAGGRASGEGRLGWYLGLSLYWAWVYLSFNASDIVGSFPDGSPVIPALHIASGVTGCLVFLVVIVFCRRLESSRHVVALEWAAAVATTAGTLLYALPTIDATHELVRLAAIVSGAASPLIALGWGVAYCRPDVRAATALTAGSFAICGVLYLVVSMLPTTIGGTAVAALPLASVACLVACRRGAGGGAGARDAGAGAARTQAASEPLGTELRELLLARGGQGRLLLGILLTMAVCGGLRIYIMHLHVDVFASPLLMALPIAAVALLFLAYSASVSRTSLSLGTLYRTALPLFAVAIAAIAVADLADARVSFAVVTAGATLIDMVTWVLLVEVSRTTHFSALLVFAVGRLAIHAGMAGGEFIALQCREDMTTFFAVAIVLLLLVASFLFADRAATVAFEPPLERELPREPDETHALTLEEGLDEIAARHGLSPRETEVFRLWATGHGSKAIEDRLTLSPATVKTHLRHIYEKCDVHSRAELLSLIEATLGGGADDLVVVEEDGRA